jgi:hypothetical protein
MLMLKEPRMSTATKRRATLHLAEPKIDAPVEVPRLEFEDDAHYAKRCASIRALGVNHWAHPQYPHPARHSRNPEVWMPARADYLAAIRDRAAADRARNPLAVMQQSIRNVMGK